MKIYRANILFTPSKERLEVLERGFIVVGDDGNVINTFAPKAAAPAAEPVKEAAPPDFPEGYTPPSRNKPQSREWC